MDSYAYQNWQITFCELTESSIIPFYFVNIDAYGFKIKAIEIIAIRNTFYLHLSRSKLAT